jgi:hypothetical protein
LTFSELHGIIPQEIEELFTATAVGTSNPTIMRQIEEDE